MLQDTINFQKMLFRLQIFEFSRQKETFLNFRAKNSNSKFRAKNGTSKFRAEKEDFKFSRQKVFAGDSIRQFSQKSGLIIEFVA